MFYLVFSAFSVFCGELLLFIQTNIRVPSLNLTMIAVGVGLNAYINNFRWFFLEFLHIVLVMIHLITEPFACILRSALYDNHFCFGFAGIFKSFTHRQVISIHVDYYPVPVRYGEKRLAIHYTYGCWIIITTLFLFPAGWYYVRYLPVPAQKGICFRIQTYRLEKDSAVIVGIYIKHLSAFNFHDLGHNPVLNLSANAFVGLPA